MQKNLDYTKIKLYIYCYPTIPSHSVSSKITSYKVFSLLEKQPRQLRWEQTMLKLKSQNNPQTNTFTSDLPLSEVENQKKLSIPIHHFLYQILNLMKNRKRLFQFQYRNKIFGILYKFSLLFICLNHFCELYFSQQFPYNKMMSSCFYNYFLVVFYYIGIYIGGYFLGY